MNSIVVVVALLVMLISVSPERYAAAQSVHEHELQRAALRALRLGEDYQAIRLLTKAIASNPRCSSYRNDRGVAFKRSGNLEQALRDYSKAIEITPNFGSAFNNRGVVYLVKGDSDKAIADFTKALGLQKDKGRLYSNRAIAYQQKGNLDQALKDYESSAAQGITDPKVYTQWAECLRQKGRRAEAVRVLKRVLPEADDPGLRKDIEDKIASITGTALSPGLDCPPASVNRVHRKARSDNVARAVTEYKPGTLTNDANHHRGACLAEGQGPDVSACGISRGMFQVIEGRARDRLTAALSPSLAEIFRQGLWFLDEADTSKALIRFEDVQKLAERDRNQLAAAWCLVEIGRIVGRTDSQAKGSRDLRKALQVFTRHNATEEVVATLLSMAANSRKAGKKDEASNYCSLANKKMAELHIPTDAVASKDRKAPGPLEAADDLKLPDPGPTPRLQQTQAGNRVVKAAPGSANNGNVPCPPASVSPPAQPPQPAPTAQQFAGVRAPQQAAGPERSVHDGVNPVSFSAAKEIKQASVPKFPGPARVPDPPRRLVRRAELEPAPPRIDPEEKQTPTTRPPRETDGHRVKALAAQLKTLKARNDGAQIAAVLETLGEEYLRMGKEDLALENLTSALSMRQRLEQTRGQGKLLVNIGRLLEKRGELARAYEHYTLARFFSSVQEGSAPDGQFEAMVSSLAAKMSLDPKEAAAAFEHLWKARYQYGPNGPETEVLYLIGKMFERAGRYDDSLLYLERSTASMLADKARLYAKRGQDEQAGKYYADAMESFRRLDFHRYLQIKHQTWPQESRLK